VEVFRFGAAFQRRLTTSRGGDSHRQVSEGETSSSRTAVLGPPAVAGPRTSSRNGSVLWLPVQRASRASVRAGPVGRVAVQVDRAGDDMDFAGHAAWPSPRAVGCRRTTDWPAGRLVAVLLGHFKPAQTRVSGCGRAAKSVVEIVDERTPWRTTSRSMTAGPESPLARQ